MFEPMGLRIPSAWTPMRNGCGPIIPSFSGLPLSLLYNVCSFLAPCDMVRASMASRTVYWAMWQLPGGHSMFPIPHRAAHGPRKTKSLMLIEEAQRAVLEGKHNASSSRTSLSGQPATSQQQGRHNLSQMWRAFDLNLDARRSQLEDELRRWRVGRGERGAFPEPWGGVSPRDLPWSRSPRDLLWGRSRRSIALMDFRREWNQGAGRVGMNGMAFSTET